MATSLSSPKLSAHFTLHELLASQTATRKNITEQFEPPAEIIENLKFLSKNLLEKLRDFGSKLVNKQFFNKIKKSDLDFDQL